MDEDKRDGFRLYRKIQKGEYFVVFGDCSQGGSDSNFVQFMSKTQIDIPLVFQYRGVAAEMTPYLREALNWIYRMTGVKPTVALERNNGGASEMHHLIKYNEGMYSIYYAKDELGRNTDKAGWDTTGGQGGYKGGGGVGTRPKMLGEWLMAYEGRAVRIYDKETQEQHQTFIITKQGKPEAAPNTHDDAVMSAAGVYQMYQTENPPRTVYNTRRSEPKRLRFNV
jgi:hypothetical protein